MIPKKFNVESIPEPFIGNPQSASVVLLNLNPGDSDKDVETHKGAAFRKAMELNLCREPQKYPFCALNPEFEQTPCGKWWRKCLKELLDELDVDTVAEKLLVIEWFPYHSKKGKVLPKPPTIAILFIPTC